MSGRQHADVARHKSAAFLKQREELRNLLIPFNEDLLSTNAPKALEFLKQQPDLLDADMIHDLVEEKPKKMLEEGVGDNYGVGFGEEKGREVTSEWSRWLTFAGDRDIWKGDRDGFTQYLTQDPSRNRVKREYSHRVAVCVAILKLVYEDLHRADGVASMIKDFATEVRELDLGPDQLMDKLRDDKRLEKLWFMDSSLIRGHMNLADGGLLGESRHTMTNEVRIFAAIIHGTSGRNMNHEDRAKARKTHKKEAKVRQQVQNLKSHFVKAGAGSGVAEMLSLLCVRETYSAGDSDTSQTPDSPGMKNRLARSKSARANVPRMKELIAALQGNASSADLDGDGEISLHELTQRFLKARALGVANLLSLISIRKQLTGCDLRGARLDDMNLQFASLDGCDLRGASLARTDMEWSSMSGGDFRDTDFTEACLVECNMTKAKLTCMEPPEHGKEHTAVGVSFFRADLAKCNFRGARMSFADLREVNARQAIFNATLMRYARFEPLGGGGVTDMRGAFFDDADMTGCIGLEETQFNELVPRKMKKFVLHKMTVKKLMKSVLPSASLDIDEDSDGDDDEDGDEEEAEDEDEDEDDDEDEDEDEDEDGDEEAADEDEGENEDEDIVEDDEADEEAAAGSPSGDGEADTEIDPEQKAGAVAASETLKQQQLLVKQAHQDRLMRFRAQEDKLIQEYADRWDRHGNKAAQSQRVEAYITAVDDGESEAVKPLQKKLKALKKAHKHVMHAVNKDRSNKKDRRALAMAEFLLDTVLLEKQFKLIVATKDEGVDYTRAEIVAFARTADELVRSSMSILRGKWVPGQASALRTRKVENNKRKHEQWVALLTPVPYYARGETFSPEYEEVLNDENLLRVTQQWCELLTGDKGLCLQYRTNQKGPSNGEILKIVTSPFPNYKGDKLKTKAEIFQRRKQELANNAMTHQNPVALESTGRRAESKQKTLEDVVSFSIGVRELQRDGDVDTENLVYVFSHFDFRVLALWMDEITRAREQEAKDIERMDSKPHLKTNPLNRDFDDSCGIRNFEFVPKLSEPYNGSLILTMPNEHAPSLVGFRRHLPRACNGVDDENDADEPDLASPSGRAVRRFQKVRADFDMLLATFKTAVPDDIDERAEKLELFLAEQNLQANTVYDETALKNMFKMTMKVMRKDLKELDHLSKTLVNLTLPISPTNWEDTLDTWLAVEQLCGEVESQKSQRVLEMLFADDNVTVALGMAVQLREIRTMTSGTPGDALPEGLMKRLKHGLGSHIKRNYYTYYKAIGMEQASIDRVVHYQAVGIGVVNSIIMAMFVGLFNFLITYYLDENSITQLKSFIVNTLFFFL